MGAGGSDPVNAPREASRRIGGWFLGPKSENAQVFEEMVLYILRDYFYWRRNYYPSDEILVTQHMRRESLDDHDALLQNINEMLARLKRHFPFFNPRYIAHMLSDQTMASLLGYLAGMLYNPNNVTPEAAPVTVEWEFEVSAQILRLLGFRVPSDEADGEPGWAHLTGGGTVATLEALWVARNAMYFPLAAREAARGTNIEVVLANGERYTLASLSPDQCLRMRPIEALALPAKIRAALGAEGAARAACSPFHLASSGVTKCFAVREPVIFAAGTAHYSVSKSAELLGLGRNSVIGVEVDHHFRMVPADLEAKIRRTVSEGKMPLAVVAIAGTTEEGAVDPVHEVVALRKRLERELGVSFWLHVDAAWCGYLRTLFVPDAEGVEEFVERTLTIRQGVFEKRVTMRWDCGEVIGAFKAIPHSDSVTIDPHKMGYVPYPCGAVAFASDSVRQFIAHDAPYITATEPALEGYETPKTIGPYILEGSKPGAAAAALWLSHKMIPPDRAGYGEIMRASLLGARELHERLVSWAEVSKANGHAFTACYHTLTSGPPDTNIVCFAVNAEGNRSLAKMNEFTERVYQRFTIQAELGEREYSYMQPFFLSRTRLDPSHYSPSSVQDFLARAGVDAADFESEGIFVLRATVMSPYLTMAPETGHKQELLGEFMSQLAKETIECLK